MVLGWHGREKEEKRMQRHKLGLCKLLWHLITLYWKFPSKATSDIFKVIHHLLSRSIYASAKIAANPSGQHFTIKGVCNCFGHIFFFTGFCSASTSPWKIKVTFCNKWSHYDISRQAKDKLYNSTIKMLLIKAKIHTRCLCSPMDWKNYCPLS